MKIAFNFHSIGLEFLAIGEYHKGFHGTCVEPPEPDELEIHELLLASTDTDVSFLLDSTIVDRLYEDAYDAMFSHLEEERACAAEAKADQRREEESMCRFC